ncbi:MAG: Fur family transcriptional regulator [Acidimicrobiales bacterium]
MSTPADTAATADNTGSASTGTAVDDIIARLRANGGRATPARRATIEVLLAGGHDHHLSADDVAAAVRRRLPDVAESSVYRTLSLLEMMGLITHVHLGHGPSTFHLNDQTHRHLVCRSCQATIEVPAAEFVDLARRLDDKYGFTMRSEHFAILGECRECRRSDA